MREETTVVITAATDNNIVRHCTSISLSPLNTSRQYLALKKESFDFVFLLTHTHTRIKTFLCIIFSYNDLLLLSYVCVHIGIRGKIKKNYTLFFQFTNDYYDTTIRERERERASKQALVCVYEYCCCCCCC